MLLLSWAWRPEIILTLGLAAAIHLVGRWRLKQRGSTASGESLALGGLFGRSGSLWIALMSPIDVLSGQFFFMHMIQHLLLVMIAPPLLLIADPMPIMVWGLPAALRLEVGRWLRPDATFRRVLRALTTPGLVWLYFVAALVGWHDPNAYNADAAIRAGPRPGAPDLLWNSDAVLVARHRRCAAHPPAAVTRVCASAMCCRWCPPTR